MPFYDFMIQCCHSIDDLSVFHTIPQRWMIASLSKIIVMPRIPPQQKSWYTTLYSFFVTYQLCTIFSYIAICIPEFSVFSHFYDSQTFCIPEQSYTKLKPVFRNISVVYLIWEWSICDSLMWIVIFWNIGHVSCIPQIYYQHGHYYRIDVYRSSMQMIHDSYKIEINCQCGHSSPYFQIEKKSVIHYYMCEHCLYCWLWSYLVQKVIVHRNNISLYFDFSIKYWILISHQHHNACPKIYLYIPVMSRTMSFCWELFPLKSPASKTCDKFVISYCIGVDF